MQNTYDVLWLCNSDMMLWTVSIINQLSFYFLFCSAATPWKSSFGQCTLQWHTKEKNIDGFTDPFFFVGLIIFFQQSFNNMPNNMPLRTLLSKITLMDPEEASVVKIFFIAAILKKTEQNFTIKSTSKIAFRQLLWILNHDYQQKVKQHWPQQVKIYFETFICAKLII